MASFFSFLETSTFPVSPQLVVPFISNTSCVKVINITSSVNLRTFYRLLYLLRFPRHGVDARFGGISHVVDGCHLLFCLAIGGPSAAIAIGLFFNTLGAKFSHVGIYLGDNRMVHAFNERTGVRLDSLRNPYFAQRITGYRTVIG